MDKQKVRRAPRLLGRAASIAVRLWNEEHLHRLLVGTRRFVLCALLMQAERFRTAMRPSDSRWRAP